MSKRPRLGDESGGSVPPQAEDYDGNVPPLSPPSHFMPTPDHAIDWAPQSQAGFNPTPDSDMTSSEVSGLPRCTLAPFSASLDSSLHLPDMGQKSPKLPDFEELSLPPIQDSDSTKETDTLWPQGSTSSGINPDQPDCSISSFLTMEINAMQLPEVIQAEDAPLEQHQVLDSTPDLKMDSIEPLMYPDGPEINSLINLILDSQINSGDDFFYDAHEEGYVNNEFLEDVDPAQNLMQEREEQEHSSLSDESEQFYDALDTAPMSPTACSYQPGANVPLYTGAKVSVHDAATALLTLVLGCKISGEVLSRILALLDLILPEGHKLFKSVFKFYKHFEHIKSPLNLIYFCSVCCQSLKDKNSQCTTCLAQTKVAFYISVPLTDQLKRLYARPGFTDLLSYRHKRQKKNADNYEDIYDGEIYNSIAPTLGPLDISLFWNTDGISLYSSSSYQVWPFYFSINELPPNLRHKEENVLLGGIAFGYEKPHPNILMKPIFEEIKILRTKGIEVVVPNSDLPVNIKCHVLCGSCDAPAKAIFMRMNQFNGHHGCHLCLIRGEKSERTGLVFVYPFEEQIQLRTQEEYNEDVPNQANGIKGPTYLFYLVWSFFMTSTAVDVMHCVYLGICRQIFHLWFSAENIKKVFGENVEKKALLNTLSKMFTSFSPPHYFNRPPRDLKHVHYFKAAEFRTWLFSTALPVFEKYMKEPYLNHFKKLVCAISLLNQRSISKNDVEVAGQLLRSFVQEWQELFGLRNMSYNVHCLLHLPDVVRKFGPLFVSSCFAYENINGILARLVHGTRYAGLQIQSNLGLLRNVPTLIKSIVNAKVKSFCRFAMSHVNRLSVSEKIDSNTFVVGQIEENHTLDSGFSQIIKTAFQGMVPYFFFRLRKGHFLYVSTDYDRGIRDSANVKYLLDGKEMYGCVKFFVKVENFYYAVIQRYVTSYCFYVKEPIEVAVESVLKFQETELVDVIPVSHLECVCFKMRVDLDLYLSPPVNYSELE